MIKFKKRNVLLIKILLIIMTISIFDLNITSINFKRPKEQQKYILYECSGDGLCGGLVDRFKGIINAYAWALFTNRNLIVKMTKPCDFINLMVPNQINWNLDLDHLVIYEELKENYTIHKINGLDNSEYRDNLANMDIINYQNKSDVISVFTNLEWISAYARNKYV